MSYRNGPRPKNKPTRKPAPPPPPPAPVLPLGMTPNEDTMGRGILSAYDTLGKGLSLAPPFQGAELPPLMVDLRPRNPAPKPIGTPDQIAAYNTPRGLTSLAGGANRTADT